MFRKVKKVHFVGIGGIGMSGIAELLLNLGFKVSGSDLKLSTITNNLSEKGAIIENGHNSSNLKDCDVLVYSSAVQEDNPEIIEANARGIPVIRRAEMLGELIAVKQTSIAVSGTHGKTTTSSMIGSMLSEAKLDPTLVVGGLVKNLDTNSLLGTGELIVVEADEFDRSFLQLRPTIAMITNIELEHTDCYENLEDLQNAFTQFSNATPFYGVVIVGVDSPALQNIVSEINRPIITFGLSPLADLRAESISFSESKTQFSVKFYQEVLGDITLNVPGEHNVLNSLAAIALGIELGIPFDVISSGLQSYGGVRRRFEIKGIVNDIMVVDDYAHHPTEVSATLQAARSGWNRRIVAVFQPHLFTRTRDFHADFAKAFMQCDVLVVTDIFPAREKPIPGITGELVANSAKEFGHPDIHYEFDLEKLPAKLDKIVQPGDLMITIGAGNIWRYCDSYFHHLSERVEA